MFVKTVSSYSDHTVTLAQAEALNPRQCAPEPRTESAHPQMCLECLGSVIFLAQTHFGFQSTARKPIGH